ncbi:hypothetical protein PAE0908 [Pyrobaculum aerophilum str. IM2]|uniref:Uncharacterized protein n=1 Tax=Pyrobaculum aerophilum (strain ATCC 51768 / DSM 7523 / JCM 9630 / CIP 104966 / NBRC 100827 / IM2) TaxID=178306 RepID=Q8ZY82_PYRAE|nr:hypothetical protein PAE0908 [Pyrobaculum aerophilum str. IM2]
MEVVFSSPSRVYSRRKAEPNKTTSDTLFLLAKYYLNPSATLFNSYSACYIRYKLLNASEALSHAFICQATA